MEISRAIIEPYYCDSPNAEGQGTGTTQASLLCIMDMENLLKIELDPSISSDPTSVYSLYSPENSAKEPKRRDECTVVHHVQLITSKERAQLCEYKFCESRQLLYFLTYVSAIIPGT